MNIRNTFNPLWIVDNDINKSLYVKQHNEIIHSLTDMHVVSIDVNEEIITLFKDEFKVRAIPNVQSSESEVDNNNGGTDNNNNNAVNSHNNNEQLQPI